MFVSKLEPRCGRLLCHAANTPLRLWQDFIWNIYELNWSMNFKLFCWCQSDARRWLLCDVSRVLLRSTYFVELTSIGSYRRCRCCRHNRLTFSSPFLRLISRLLSSESFESLKQLSHTQHASLVIVFTIRVSSLKWILTFSSVPSLRTKL